MTGFRFNQRQLGKLTPRGVHYLRQTNYQLIARATHGSPSDLRAYAARLRNAHDELRFRLPLFASYLLDIAAVADGTALEREQRRFRVNGHPRGKVRSRTPGLANFTQRYRA
jgi:hypothetical protein